MGCVVRVPRSLAARHRIAVGALCHQSMRVFCGAADGSRCCTGGWAADVHSIKRPYTRHLFSRCTPCFARLCCFFFFFCTRPRTSAEWPLCIRIDLTNALSLSQVFFNSYPPILPSQPLLFRSKLDVCHLRPSFSAISSY